MPELTDIADERVRVRDGLGQDISVEGWMTLIMADLTTAARADQARMLTDGPDRAEAISVLRDALVKIGAMAAEAVYRLDNDETWPNVDRRRDARGRRATDREDPA